MGGMNSNHERDGSVAIIRKDKTTEQVRQNGTKTHSNTLYADCALGREEVERGFPSCSKSAG